MCNVEFGFMISTVISIVLPIVLHDSFKGFKYTLCYFFMSSCKHKNVLSIWLLSISKGIWIIQIKSVL